MLLKSEAEQPQYEPGACRKACGNHLGVSGPGKSYPWLTLTTMWSAPLQPDRRRAYD
jgi:hypothetical protein